LAQSKTVFKVRDFTAPPLFHGGDGLPVQRPLRRPRLPVQPGFGGATTLIANFEYHLLDNIQITDTFTIASTHAAEQK
jgi:hypothetical protein